MATSKEAHLRMVQAVIARLAQSSMLLKGWIVLLVSGLLVSTAVSSAKLILLASLPPILVLWGLDGYFLWQERLFRDLYDHVRGQDETEVDYLMDVRAIHQQRSSRWLSATVSGTLTAFHGAILVTVLIAYLVMSGES